MQSLTRTHVVATGVAAAALLAAVTLASAAFAAEDVAAPAWSTGNHVAANTAAPESAAAINRDEQRIKDLHDRLQVTPAQEALWSKVADVMRSNDKTMDGLATSRHDTAATRSATEDLRSYGEITQAHAAGIRSFAATFGALYDSMTAEQKTNADEVFRSEQHKPHSKKSV